MQPWTILVMVGFVAVLLAWHFSYTAARLDRLHARVEGSAAALDAQLVRRAEAALELASAPWLDAASSVYVASCAGASLQAAEGARITTDVQQYGIEPRRAAVETELTQCLEAVLSQWDSTAFGLTLDRRTLDGVPVGPPRTWLSSGGGDDTVRRRLGDACDRVDLAYRFHDEAVRDVRRVRATWMVRTLHLAGHTALPEQLDFETHVDGASHASAWR